MLNIKRKQKIVLLVVIDAVVLTVSFFAAALLRFSVIVPQFYGFFGLFVLSQAVILASLAFSGSYKGIRKYTNINDTIRLLFSLVVSFVTIFLVGLFFSKTDVAFLITFLILCFVLLMAVRGYHNIVFSLRHYINTHREFYNRQKRAAVFGGGYTGRVMVETLINNPDDGYIPVVIIDDNEEKHGLNISGVLIAGGRDMLDEIVRRLRVDIIIIAIQQISKQDLKSIYQCCMATGLPVKIVPRLSNADSFFGQDSISLRDVRMDELLGREEFAVNMDLINSAIGEKTVLVTGGAGSIGSELCRQILRYGCKKLIILDAHENGIFELDRELSENYSMYCLEIANIRDTERLKTVFYRHKPDIVFHAAAYKHVPMMEQSPSEAVKNNVLGTQNIIKLSNTCGVKKLVLISTDKAVNPANIMGATKRIAEMLIQCNDSSRTQAAAVRFGNVLGSNGSVIGIFLDQIKKGGPITLTHNDIKRYFMTIPEAVSLVLQAGAMAKNNEVFVLDMGEAVRIYDLAVDLIKMQGLVPNKDIEIKVTGLRAGEKLFEELTFDYEKCDRTLHDGIMVCNLKDIDKNVLNSKLEKLCDAAQQNDDQKVEQVIFEIIPSIYRNQSK